MRGPEALQALASYLDAMAVTTEPDRARSCLLPPASGAGLATHDPRLPVPVGHGDRAVAAASRALVASVT